MKPTSISQFIDHHYRHFNAAAMKDAAHAYRAHLDRGGTMLVTLAGAMSTAELGLSLAEMIRRDKVHAICCTGANLEEDLFNLVAQKHYERIPRYRELTVQDEQNLLHRHLNRVTDTCIPEAEAMRRIEAAVAAEWAAADQAGAKAFPHQFLYKLLVNGTLKEHYQIDPADSWMCAAAERNLPIFVPGWEDSTLGNMYAAHCITGAIRNVHTVRSGVEYMMHLAEWYLKTARVNSIGFFQIGGGIAGDFPIIDALLEARVNGKQVAVLVELKARFDEENNIEWARKLEDEGVHVVYGVRGLKTHAKVCLVVRREPEGIRRYVHLGTGNYNVITSRIYTDASYFTCDKTICSDVSDLFNSLTGYSRKNSYSKLLVAPTMLRQQILDRIERETRRHRQHGDGYIAFKMNALVDAQCIQALYDASQAGVRIDLQVRGICCLRPGLPGISETISVTSVVGRFLEHARIYYFHHGGHKEVLMGSADLMPRNLDHRVEVIFPVEDLQWRELIINEILGVGLRDNVQARRLLPDGTYERKQPADGEPVVNSQDWLLTHWKSRSMMDGA